MKNGLIIGKQTLIDCFGIKKNWLYLLFIIITSSLLAKVIFSNLAGSTSFTDQFYGSVSGLFLIGFFWIVGIPYFIYLGAISVGAVSREFNEGTAMLIFARPVRRLEFIIGKALGIITYGILLNVISILFIASVIGIMFGLDYATLLALYNTSFALIIYSVFVTLLITSVGLFISLIVKKTIISMTLLFVFILLVFVFPPVINYSLESKIGNYQETIPDFAFLLGSLSTGILNSFNLDLDSTTKNSLSLVTNTYTESTYSVPIPYGLIDNPKTSDMHLIVPIILFIGIFLVLFYLGLYILKRKEIY